MSSELQQPRQRIDEIDRQLVRLVAERMTTVRSIGQAKERDAVTALRDHDREQAVLANWQTEASSHGLSDYFVGRILREVLNYSRRIQEEQLDRGSEAVRTSRVRVGFHGACGSYSDMALAKLFAERPECGLEPIGFASFAKSVDALEKGELDYSLLPIENTIAGSLNETYQLLAERQLSIVDEEILQIDHCLVGLAGASIDNLKVIRSHPVALQQCTTWLNTLSGCAPEGRTDTASSAASLLDDADLSVGAICSEDNAARLGLTVLARDIANQAHNYTRFEIGRAHV